MTGTKLNANDAEHCWDKKAVQISLVILALALAPRLMYLFEISSCPSFSTPIVDAQGYDDIARELAQEGKISRDFFRQPCFYPFFLSAVYYLTYSSIIWARTIQLLLGSVTCLLGYRLAQRIFNRPTGTIAGLLLAFYGPLIYFQSKLLGESLATFWAVLLLLLFEKTSRKRSVWSCFALGLCGGLSIITRPTFVPFFTVGCLWLMIKYMRSGASRRFVFGAIAAGAIGCLLVIIPAAAQNYRLTGNFTVMPSNGGLNLYIGNNPNSRQTVAARPGPEYRKIVNMPLKEEIFDLNKQEEFFHRKVRQYILTQPVDFIRGLFYKTVQFVCSREIPGSESIYVYRQWSNMLSLLTWKVAGYGFPFGMVLPLAIVGLIYYRHKLTGPFVLFILFYPASIILVHICSRHRAPIIGPFTILAAAGITAIWQMLRNRAWHGLALSAVAMLATVLISTLPGPFSLEKINYDAELYYGVGVNFQQRDRMDEAEHYFDKAVRLDPDSAKAHGNLAVTLTLRKDYANAIEHYEKAIHLNPDYADAHCNYASTLFLLGKYDRAVHHYRETLRIDPYYPDGQQKLKAALEKQKQNR